MFLKSQKAFLLALEPLRQISADLSKAKDVLALILYFLLPCIYQFVWNMLINVMMMIVVLVLVVVTMIS